MMNYRSEKDDVTKDQRGNCSNEESPSSVCSQLSSNICESVCCKKSPVLNLYQTRNLEVIKKSRVCYGQRYRQFCTDWYEAYPWLVLCASRSKAFCGYCCYGKFKG